jgi:hypothetical protein
LFICSYFTTSLGGQAGGLEETKLKLTQPNLAELELGLSLAILIINAVELAAGGFEQEDGDEGEP